MRFALWKIDEPNNETNIFFISTMSWIGRPPTTEAREGYPTE
jgi:hypothetical protein